MKPHEGFEQIHPPKKACVCGKWIASLLLEAPAGIAPPSAATVWTMLCCYCHCVCTKSPYQSLLSSSCWQWRTGTVWDNLQQWPDPTQGWQPHRTTWLFLLDPQMLPSSEQHLTFTQGPGPSLSLDAALAKECWDRPAAWCQCLFKVSDSGLGLSGVMSPLPPRGLWKVFSGSRVLTLLLWPQTLR